MTASKPATALKLGADAVQRVLPHRRPFLFLDGVELFDPGERPRLHGHKQIGANEPVFDGHFPGLSLWPGVYTIEGLGQACNALLVLLEVLRGFREAGLTDADALTALRGIDARHRLGARAPTEHERALERHLGGPTDRVGFAGAIDVKLEEPVFAGSTLRYEVTLTHAMANARRFDVRATVAKRPVARGTITSALPRGVARPDDDG